MTDITPHDQASHVAERCPPEGVRWHPYADIFPWIEGPAFEELKADIEKNGVLEPIVFLDGAILDGRNRYMAARDLGIEYPRVEYQGDDPLGFVISHNLTRRHLTESQRAMVVAKLAKLEVGANQHSEGLPIGRASEMMSVGERSVARAKEVRKHGTPELVAAVETGKVSVSAAAVIAKQDHDTQKRIVAEDNLKRAAAELRQAERVTSAPPLAPIITETGAAHEVISIVRRIAELPDPAGVVACMSAAMRNEIMFTEAAGASQWLSAFARALQAREMAP